MPRLPSDTVAIRVVVAEDNYLVREGIERLIHKEPDLELVASCASVDALLAIVDAERPDAVVTDIRMPPTCTDEGIQAAERLRDSHPGTGVVVLSQYLDPSYALALLSRGAAGRAYLLKEFVSRKDQLVNAVREVACGGSMIDPKVVATLVAARSHDDRSPLRFLTPRELDILAEMAHGRSNAGIGGVLVLSERAVEKHINSMFSKLGLAEEREVNRRVKAVLLFLSRTGG